MKCGLASALDGRYHYAHRLHLVGIGFELLVGRQG